MRNLFLSRAALFTVFVSAPLFAQQGELKSILVEDDSRPLVDLDRPDAPEPTFEPEPTPSTKSLDDFPPEDIKLNPIPGLEPIAVPKPRVNSESRKPLIDPRSRVVPQPVTSAAVRRPTATMSSMGFSLVPDADVPKVRGVIVGGLAQQSGMKPGDIISAINDTPANSPADVVRLLAAMNADEFDIALIRGVRRQSIRVTLPRSSRPAGGANPMRRASAGPQQRLTNSSETISPAPTTVASQPNPTTSQVFQQARPVQQPYARRPTRPARPLIGDGGRLIGNGRVINSVRRLFGR